MKITKILLKFLAKTYQEEDLRRAGIHLQYHKGMTRVFEQRVEEERDELERLGEKKMKPHKKDIVNKVIQTDSHKKSLSEAFVNSFGGYLVGFGLGIIILPISIEWIQKDPLVATLAITSVYASVSFTRSYILRRVFEKFGIEDNFIKLCIKLMKKITRRGK